MLQKPFKVVSEDVASDSIVGRLHSPDQEGQFPSVVVLGGSGGGLEWSNEVASELARNGYVAFALAYFGIPPLPKRLAKIRLEYFQAAFDWLQRQSSVQSNRHALIAASRGSELALQLGVTFAAVRSIVCYAPSSVRWGPVGGLSVLGQSAWCWQDLPLPQMPSPKPIRFAQELGKMAASWAFGVPYYETPVFKKALGDARAVELATIPVERIQGPVLLISGSDDQLWPSAQMSQMITERMLSKGHRFTVKHIDYEGAGHAIGMPDLPLDHYPTRIRHPITRVTYALGGTPEKNASAASQAWNEVLNFLAEHGVDS